MGGTSRTLNTKDKRVVNNNKLIWTAILELEEAHLGEFSFSAREVVRQIHKGSNHGSLITRERGGLKQFLYDLQKEFIDQLGILVNEEQTMCGEISAKFCRQLGFLISAYHPLFSLDIISHSHRNTELILDATKPLIRGKHLSFFGIELYSMLIEWRCEEFARELVVAKYSKRLHVLFLKYQVHRPDIAAITSKH